MFSLLWTGLSTCEYCGLPAQCCSMCGGRGGSQEMSNPFSHRSVYSLFVEGNLTSLCTTSWLCQKGCLQWRTNHSVLSDLGTSGQTAGSCPHSTSDTLNMKEPRSEMILVNRTSHRTIRGTYTKSGPSCLEQNKRNRWLSAAHLWCRCQFGEHDGPNFVYEDVSTYSGTLHVQCVWQQSWVVDLRQYLTSWFFCPPQCRLIKWLHHWTCRVPEYVDTSSYLPRKQVSDQQQPGFVAFVLFCSFLVSECAVVTSRAVVSSAKIRVCMLLYIWVKPQ